MPHVVFSHAQIMKPQLKTRDTEAQWSFLTSEHMAAMAMCLDSTKKGCRSSVFPPRPYSIFHVSPFGWSSFESFIIKLIIKTSLVAQTVKASTYNAGDLGSIPGSGRSPGEGNGNPLQYPCLENHMDGGAWWATVHGVTKSWTRLRDFTFTSPIAHSLFVKNFWICILQAYRSVVFLVLYNLSLFLASR